ncbi:MAG TPA: ATP-binding protein [Clostridia bacterium]|nr:ATP-binding protein [Clostridia bacterium]
MSRCVFELLANSLEQHLGGRCSSVVVTIHEDSSLSVSDDGPGIPTVLDPRHNAPFIELAFTTLNYTYKEKLEKFPVIGLAGVGAKCVNAVSEWMQVDTCSDSGCFRIAFSRGKLSKSLHELEESACTRGTTIRFKPDREIFGQATFDRNALANMLQPLAVLHPGFDVWLVDERPNLKNRPLVWQYCYPNGIADFLKTADLGHFKIPSDPNGA